MFRHAGKCGADTFDGVRVDSIKFEPSTNQDAALAGTMDLVAQSQRLGRAKTGPPARLSSITLSMRADERVW